jgi:hypothetical protein
MADRIGWKIFIIAIHALLGWMLCGAIIGIGREIMSMQLTLIIHAIGVPIFFGIISWIYFKKYTYTSPFATGIIFLGFVMAMNFFVVALLIEKSLEMFRSPLTTWIPFALIFMSTFCVGQRMVRGT